MKGIQLGLVGVCLSLTGIAVSTNNTFAMSAAAVGFILAVIGCLIKDEK